MIISLIGFMGCGKSHIATALSIKTGIKAIDLDYEVEHIEGQSISTIFKTKGEQYFRDLEAKTLKSIIDRYKGENIILALGGGTIVRKDSFNMVSKESTAIYLKAKEEELIKTLSGSEAEKRPLLQCANIEERIKQLFSEREKIYNLCADITIEVDNRSYDDVADEIIEKTR